MTYPRPKNIPANAGINASNELPATAIWNVPEASKPRASISDDTVNESPSVWIISSRLRFNTEKYGAAGNAEIPVAPISIPVANPIMGDNRFSQAAGTE